MLIRSFASVAVLALVLPASPVMAESHEEVAPESQAEVAPESQAEVAPESQAEVAPESQAEVMPERIDATDTLPDAKPGECYAKVIIPAKYETTAEEILVKPVSETVSVTPAVFETAETSVVEKEAFTEIKVVPTKFREEIEEVEVSKAGTSWVTNLADTGIPASPALLAGAKTSGVDLESAIVGACYKEYYIPAQYEEMTKEVLVKEESEEIKVAPAEFEETEEIVVVKQATKKKVYRPAEYETIEEKIEIEPAKSVWKKGDGPITKIDNSTGEIMCLIQVPAVYKTITKTVLKSEAVIDLVEVPEETKAIKVNRLVSDAVIDKVKIPAEYKTVTLSNKTSDARFTWTSDGADGGTYTGNQICLKDIPAEYTKVTKLVVDAAATIEEDKVEPVAKLVKVSNVVTPATESRELIEAEYKTVEKTTKTASERLEWRRILCRTNMGPDINKRIQQALKDAGVYNGPVDGAVGRGTMLSVEKYQKENGLATGGITIDMLEKLGVM